MRCNRAALRTAHADEAVGTTHTAELLKPNPADHTAHRKAEEIDGLVITEMTTNMPVQLFRKGAQRNRAKAMRKVRNQQRKCVCCELPLQAAKQTWGIPQPVHKNQRTPDG